MNKRLLQNQQMIMKAKGFYNGKCDGIWSAKTIAAKKEYESHGSFKPAYPNNGMPFGLGPTNKLPSGVYYDPAKGKGVLTCDELTQDKLSEWSSDLVEAYDNRKDTIHTPEAETVETKKIKTAQTDTSKESKSSKESSTDNHQSKSK